MPQPPQQFRVAVPPGAKGGQLVQIQNHNVQVRIPKGLQPGDTFVLELQEGRKPKIVSTASGSDRDLHLDAAPANKLSSYAELGTALCVGMLIGSSILLGFVLGVLAICPPPTGSLRSPGYIDPYADGNGNVADNKEL